jgi:hypothetical protein
MRFHFDPAPADLAPTLIKSKLGFKKEEKKSKQMHEAIFHVI